MCFRFRAELVDVDHVHVHQVAAELLDLLERTPRGELDSLDLLERLHR